MKQYLKNVDTARVLRYVIVGVLTTGVNFGCFLLFRYVFHWELVISNEIAIIMAILFSFVTNKIFVFHSKTTTFFAAFREGIVFIGSRLFTMFVEIFGVCIFSNIVGLDDFIGKFLMQFVVFVLNYIVSRFFVFNEAVEDGKVVDAIKEAKKKESMTFKDWYEESKIYFYAVLIPSIFMLGVWIADGISPFGDNSLIIVDGLHQYMPFFSVYYDKLMNGGNLNYTWQVGMGANFLSLFSYYLSSPFNFFVVMFEKMQLPMAVSLIVTVKIILSSFNFSWFCCHRGEKSVNSIITVGLSVAYALNNYVVGYYWNVMWMDVIMVFPLLVLGLERMVRKKDCRLYVLCLCYSLYCNYYIGYMVCIGMILFFFLQKFDNIKHFALSSIRFAISSLLSGGLAAALLMPAYYGIMTTASAQRDLPKWDFYTNVADLLQTMLPGVMPITNQTFDGGVNLFCGTLALFGIGLYVANKSISIKDKIMRIVILAFLVLSFDTKILNYIWHGFHDQYGIPNRFSFLFIFLVLWMTHDALIRIKAVSKTAATIVYFICNGFILFTYLFADGKEPVYTYLIGVLLINVYYFLVMAYSEQKLDKRWMLTIMSALLTIEICANAGCGFANDGVVSISTYFKDTQTMEQTVAMEEKEGFHRSELLKYRMLDENSWHNLNSVGIFGSTAIGKMVTLMGKMGFYTGANEYLYRGGTPLTDAILGVKYLYVNDMDAYMNSDFTYDKTVDSIKIYKNPYVLPIGFLVRDEIANWDYMNTNPFVVQNDLAEKATGYGDIFQLLNPSYTVTGEYCDATNSGGGIFKFTPVTTGETMKITVSFTVSEDMDLYVNPRGNNIKKIHLTIDGKEVSADRYQLQTFHIGNMKKGQAISLTYEMNDGTTEGSVYIYAAAFQKEQFEKVYKALASTGLTNVSYTDTTVSGEIDCKENGTVWTSIPYDAGWKVYVDGEEMLVQKTGEALISIPVMEGKHSIRFVYEAVGLREGLWISLVSWMIFMVYCGVRRRKKINDRA